MGWLARTVGSCLVAMTAAGSVTDYESKYVDLRGTLPRREDARYRVRTLDRITTVVLHHTATTGQGFRSVAEYHTQSRKWPEIGYQYGVDWKGVKYHLLDATTVSNHTQGHNSRAVSIVLLGNYQERQVTPEQVEAVMSIVEDLREQCPNLDRMWLHSETKATACPGRTAREAFAPLLFGPRP